MDADTCWQRVSTSFEHAAAALTYPSVLYRPSLSIDGDLWCARYGDDLQSGVCGFGLSPSAAMRDFDKNWYAALPILATRPVHSIPLGDEKIENAWKSDVELFTSAPAQHTAESLSQSIKEVRAQERSIGLAVDSLERIAATAPAQRRHRESSIATELREYAANPGYSHCDYADVMSAGADAIDRLESVKYPDDVTPGQTVPMHEQENAWKSDVETILDFRKFAARLLDVNDLGLAVTAEVRDIARALLNLPKVET